MNLVLSPSFRRLRLLALVLCELAFTVLSASAGPTRLQVSQITTSNTLRIRDWETATIRISYGVTSTTDDASYASISFVLDPNFEMVAMTRSSDVDTATYNSAFRTGVFAFGPNLPAGTTGEVAVQVRFLYTTAEGTVANFRPLFMALNAPPVRPAAIPITAISAPVITGTVYTKGVRMVKEGASSVSQNAPYIEYYIRHGNTGSTGQDVPSYVVEDIFPPNTRLRFFNTDRFWSSSQNVTAKYITNLNGSWRQFGAAPLYSTGAASSVSHYESALGLPATEWVTGLRFEYGTLPGGGPMHPDNMANYLYINLGFVTPPAAGVLLTNCATAAAPSETTATGCVNTTTVPSTPAYYTYSTYTASAPIEMGEAMIFTGYLGLRSESNASMVNPMIIVMLPPEIEYLGNFRLSGIPWDASAKNPPAFERFDNFRGTGRTLLRWRWTAASPFTLPAAGAYSEVTYQFDTKVRNGTSNGSYTTDIYGSWGSPAGFEGDQWQRLDAEDIDGDGSVTDTLLSNASTINVSTNGGMASVRAVMEVKGEADTLWSKFPATGLTVPSGQADYRVTVYNEGGVIMKDPVIIDILPAVGDLGVIDPAPRGSQWTPFLAGPVTAPAGITVSYSSSSLPCRDEITPGLPLGCEALAWSVLPPADITTVRSLKFDGTGLTLRPLENLVIEWPMRAPLTAPTGGEIAWNSFGMIMKRADDNVSTTPAEPVKTGIAIKPPDPPFYGDHVWLDTNRNGIQESGEPGINGVRIELYRDNGDRRSDPSTDTLISFTVSSTGVSGPGYYRFGNISDGHYFAVMIPPDDYGITEADAGGDNTKDSDGQPMIHRGRRAAIFPVTQLDTLEEDLSWDLGLYDRSGLPSVWAVATQADGKLILGGKFTATHGVARRNIARVGANGAADPSFNPGTGFDGSVRSLEIRGDRKIWVGGNFTAFNGTDTMGVALLNSDGTHAGSTAQPDTSDVNWVGLRGTTMFVAGAFGKIGGQPCGNIAALQADGTVDTSFAILPGANAGIHNGAILADGSLILVGAFTSYGSESRKRVVKVKPNGQVDPGFNPGAGANGPIFSVKLIDDGRFVVTGAFTSFDGVACNGTMRLMANGRPDPTLGPSTLVVKSINASN